MRAPHFASGSPTDVVPKHTRTGDLRGGRDAPVAHPLRLDTKPIPRSPDDSLELGRLSPISTPMTTSRGVSEVRPLPSAGITRRHHYYEPRRLPIEAARSVMDCRPALSSSATSVRRATGLLASWGLPSFQHNFQRPPPPITPGRPTAAPTCCFTASSRLRLLRKVGHDRIA